MSDKPTVLLEAWLLLTLNGRPHQLWGFATDHPSLPGFRRLLATSRVLRFDADRCEAETINTVYQLRHAIHDVQYDYKDANRISIADLTTILDPESGTWVVGRDSEILAGGLASMTEAVLAMLAILDREGA
jgi:hypothetical protein